jgi:hypothetical protein
MIVHRWVFYLRQDFSGTGFYPHLGLEPSQLRPTEDGDRIQFTERCVLNERLEDGKCPAVHEYTIITSPYLLFNLRL